MATAYLNPELLIAGLLRKARAMPDAVAWLTARHGEAMEAVLAGDEYVTSTTDEGGSNTAERQLPANVLLQLYESALQIYESDAAIAAGTAVANGSVRYADFSSHPCTLG